MTTIDNGVFGCCTSLVSLTIGTGVKEIGYIDETPLKKVIWLPNTPPEGYTKTRIKGSINYVANDNYSGLSDKTIYPYLSSMFEVNGIKYVPVNPSARTCDAIDCAYDSTKAIHIDKTVNYKGIEMTVKNIMPYTCYANKNITTVNITADYIGSYAFENCSKLTKAELTNTISLNYGVFSGCSNLQEFIIPNSVTIIKDNCFKGCSSLASITIPDNVGSIGNYVFDGCESLKDVNIAERSTELKLGSNGSSPLFSDCPLKNVYIGGNITYLTSSSYGYSPFYRNTTLETVEITNKETEISENEFYGCTSLKNVTIGDGIETIGNYAFSGCASLDNFSFGTSLKSIGKEAFSDCTAMTKLVAKTKVPPTCGDQALDDINKWTCTLYVPQAYTDAYKAAAQWKEFFFYDSIETGVKSVNADNATEIERFNLNGTRLTAPQKGINIIRMSDGTIRKVMVK